jgi:hypothetical protein
MSGAFSYFDTATGAVHLFADLDRLENEQGPSDAISRTRELGQRWWLDPPSLDAVDEIFNRLVEPAQRDLVQHELRHSHQLAMYPYMYLCGVRAINTTAIAIHALTERDDVVLYPDPVLGARLPLPDERDPTIHGIRQSLYAAVARYWFSFDGGSASPVPVDLENPVARYITEQHLLEDEVAVYQYRLDGGEWDGRAFARWREELPGACPTFRLLTLALENRDQAVRLLPLLVYWAFQTTTPMGAFLELMQLVREGHDLVELSRVDVTDRACEALIADRYPAADPSFPFMGWAQCDPPVRLDRDVELLLDAGFHPCRPQVRRLREERRERLELIYPTTEIARTLQQRLPPPAILVRVNDSTFGPGSVGFSLYPAPESFPDSHDGVPWREVVLNLEYAHDIAHIMFLGSDGEHGCPHRGCPHRSELCRNYPFVPRDWRECGYPKWLEDFTSHQVDREQRVLRAIAN